MRSVWLPLLPDPSADAEARPLSTDYAVAVLGFVFLLSGLTWLFQGRKSYCGPRDLGGLLELARVEVNHGEVSSSRPASMRSGRRSSSRPGTTRAGSSRAGDKSRQGDVKEVV